MSEQDFQLKVQKEKTVLIYLCDLAKLYSLIEKFYSVCLKQMEINIKPQFNFTIETLFNQGRVSKEDIKQMKTWLRTEKELPQLCDEQIAIFLMSCDNEENRTKNTIKAYYKCKKIAPELFDNRDLVNRKDLLQQLQVLDFVILPKKTQNNCVIIHCKIIQTNYWLFNLQEAIVILFMLLEGAVNDNPPPQGLIVLFDMEGIGLMHLTRARIGHLRNFFHFVQEGNPIKIKEIHVLNSVYFLDRVLSLLKPFMKIELLNLIYFHPPKMNIEKLYQFIPKECLPEEYGGTLDSARELHNQTIERLNEMKGFFEAEELQRKQLL